MAAGNSINESTTGITGFTGTAFTGTAMTEYAIVAGGATSSTLQHVSGLGTATHVLTSNGAGALPTWQASSGGTVTILKDAGTSTSGTPATLVASITAGASKKLVSVNALGSQTSATNTQFKCIITFTDATTTEVSTSASTAATLSVNNSGYLLTVGGAYTSLGEFTKEISGIRYETLGSSVTGTRSAIVSAQEVSV